MALPSNFNHNIIRLNVRCPICGDVYDWQRLRILGERDQQVLTYIDCGRCSTAVLTVLSMSQSGMTAQGTVTDLTLDEVYDYSEDEAVTLDDVLAVHQLLDRDETRIITKLR